MPQNGTVRSPTRNDSAVPFASEPTLRSPRRVGCLVAVVFVVCSACGTQVGQYDGDDVFVVSEATAERSVEMFESASTVPHMPVEPILSQEVAETVAETTSVPPALCSLNEIGVDQLLVFGNSTDYTFGDDEPIEMTAWPNLLVRHARGGLMDGVAVRNESQPGQTMGIWDAWGPDPRLRLTLYAPIVLDSVEPGLLQETLVLVAPSFIDLQESGFDVSQAVADLSVVIATVEAYGPSTLVLPMNYVSNTMNDAFPDLNPSIESFNRLLARRGVLVEPYVDSSLRGDGGESGGKEGFYDDFPGRDREGHPVGADGFHPDSEGQFVKTLAVLEMLGALVERTSASPDCVEL
jgi:hypothetical protein